MQIAQHGDYGGGGFCGPSPPLILNMARVTYEYRHRDGRIEEIVQDMRDAAFTHHPETGEPITRIISGGAGTIFRGDAWPDKERKA